MLLSGGGGAGRGRSVPSALASLYGADGGGFIEQAVLFFLAGQAGEVGVERLVGVEERFFAVLDRRVGALGVLGAHELPGALGIV